MPDLNLADIFSKCFPKNSEVGAWAEAVAKVLPEYQIDTPKRLAAFLAQCGHESQGFTAVKENLNYSAEALTATWPKRFPPEVAKQYARQPERIANRAYCDRMGNGPEASGDGWKWRGRGVIQLTGRWNYLDFSKSVDMALEDVVAYLETKAGAVESACWFWKTRNLNPLADDGDIIGITKIINGGVNGAADRQQRYERYLPICQQEAT